MKYAEFITAVCNITGMKTGMHQTEAQNKEDFKFHNRILGLAYGKAMYTSKIKSMEMIYTHEQVLDALSSATKFVDSIINQIDNRQNLLIAQTKQNLEHSFYEK